MPRTSHFKRVLAEGRHAAGTMVFEFSTPGISRVLEATGLDFVIFDMEHSGIEIGGMRELLSWARAAAFTPMVRVPAAEYHFLSRVLDLGAQGVMVPMVGTPEQAQAVVRACTYPPRGGRGAAFGVAHDDFRDDLTATMEAADRETTVILQIETAEGARNVRQIAAVPGVDILWIGHFDLSLSLGIPGRFGDPRFVEAVETVAAAAREFGRCLGVMVNDPAGGAFWIERGFRAIAYSGDIWLLQRALAEGISWIRSLS